MPSAGDIVLFGADLSDAWTLVAVRETFLVSGPPTPAYYQARNQAGEVRELTTVIRYPVEVHADGIPPYAIVPRDTTLGPRLRGIRRLLEPQGYLLVYAPAWPPVLELIERANWQPLCRTVWTVETATLQLDMIGDVATVGKPTTNGAGEITMHFMGERDGAHGIVFDGETLHVHHRGEMAELPFQAPR